MTEKVLFKVVGKEDFLVVPIQAGEYYTVTDVSVDGSRWKTESNGITGRVCLIRSNVEGWFPSEMAVRAQLEEEDEYEAEDVQEVKEEGHRILRKRKSQMGPLKKKIVPLRYHFVLCLTLQGKQR